jgi:type IV pilus assembly protein PilW
LTVKSLSRRGRPSTHTSRRGTRGFSTVEVLASSVLSLMTVGTIYVTQQGQLKAYAGQRAYADSQTVTRSVMDLMTRELRLAGYNPTGASPAAHNEAGCVGIARAFLSATSTQVRFQQDLNANGAIDAALGEDVTYDISGTQLRRAVGDNAPTVLVDYAEPSTGLAFRYFNNSNPPVELIPPLAGCQLANIAKVRVTLRANVPHPHHPMRSTAESEIAVRNRALTNF